MAETNQFTIQLEFDKRADGRYHVHSDNVPGLYLAGADIHALCDDVGPAVIHLLKHNMKIDADDVRWVPTLQEVRQQFHHPAESDGKATYIVTYKAA